MTNSLFASIRAAEYERLLRKAIEWYDCTKNGSIVAFCKEEVWPNYVLEKADAYEAIPDDLKRVFA